MSPNVVRQIGGIGKAIIAAQSSLVLFIFSLYAWQKRMKTTQYFQYTRQRPDRVIILDDWIERAILHPLREYRQEDGRIRRWARIPEMGNRALRVILLEDGETVHNAFFDRDFKE